MTNFDKIIFLYILVFWISHTQGCVIPTMECPNLNITFWLYTTVTRSMPHELRILDRKTLKSAPWVVDAPIKIIIHGYTGNKDTTPNNEIRDAYMECCDYNVISVDYKYLAREPCYYHGAHNTKLVGKCTAQLIDTLVTILHFKLSSFHVIGFCMGAHAAGAIANYLWAGKLERITGLDPAFDLFVTQDKYLKLDVGDAKFVDVLHTNSLLKGKLDTSGTVDFYANGGIRQPGCMSSKIIKMGCDHARAATYFAESITTGEGFYASRCLSWISFMLGWCKFAIYDEMLFGEDVPRHAEGLYFLATESDYPFARGRGDNTSILFDNELLFYEGQDQLEQQKQQYWDTFYFLVNWLETTFERIAIV